MKVFISWSKSDSAEMAKHLGIGPDAVLERIFPGHLETFVSMGIRPGEDSIPSIEKALNECDFAIVLVTEANMKEPWLQYELGALTRPKNGEKRIVPILLLGTLQSSHLPSTMHGKQQRYAREKAGFLEVLLSLNQALSDFKTKQGFGAAPSDDHVKARFSELWPDIEKLNRKLSRNAAKARVKDPQHLLLEDIAADIAQLKDTLGVTAFLSGAREKARRADFLKEAADIVGGDHNLGRLDVAGEDLYALNIKVPETDDISRSLHEAFNRTYSGDGLALLIIDPDFFGPAHADEHEAWAAAGETEPERV